MNYRALITEDPFPPLIPGGPPWEEKPSWPCRWIAAKDSAARPLVMMYRCRFHCDGAETVRLHVTADERYEIYLNGQRFGRGPERGDPDNWFYETYDLPLTPGDHVLTVRVWSLGALAPWAQRSVQHGLLVAATDHRWLQRLATGVGPWQCRPCAGITFTDASVDVGTPVGGGPGERYEAAAIDWGIEAGDGEGWQDIAAGEYGNNGFTLRPFRLAHRLKPATLPPMMDEAITGTRVRLAEGADRELCQAAVDRLAAFTVPAHSTVRIIFDLQSYYCFYPKLTLSGGAGSTVRLTYVEALHPKEQRDNVAGKSARGVCDVFCNDETPDRSFSPLWWRCGRYVELSAITEADSLTIGPLEFRETRYPISWVPPPQPNSIELVHVLAIARRTLEVCCHETFMDCPYYEQLMYVGDTRLQALAGYALHADARPAIKAMKLIASSAINFNRLPVDAAPGDGKFIPPFAFAWIGMVHDFARYHDRPDVVRSMMPGVRSVLERFLEQLDKAIAILKSPPGWNFVDWAAAPFSYGVPPGGQEGGFNATINLLMLSALDQAAELERYVDEPQMQSRWQGQAATLRDAIQRRFFEVRRNLFRECLDSQAVSEHAQCAALLCDAIPDNGSRIVEQLVDCDDLIRCSPYFAHFLLEALYKYDRSLAFFKALKPWYDLKEQGLLTTPETFGSTRSDCHGWSAHPLFHVVASIAGVRPGGVGFNSVEIRPMLGALRELKIVTPHPRGIIYVDYRASDKALAVSVNFDGDIHGRFTFRGASLPLYPGNNVMEFEID